MKELITDYEGQRDDRFRAFVYSGTVVRMPPSKASRKLVDHAWSQIVDALGADPRDASSSMDAEKLFPIAGRLRRALYESSVCRQAIAELIEETGGDPRRHVCDPVRLRVVTVGGHRNPAAAPVYYAHRDTWYANPQEQITWWLPLHPVTVHETFEFLPNCFGRAVANDSAGFDYTRWTSKGNALKIGWQDPRAGQRELYPQLQESLADEPRQAFQALPGEVIVFSGQHLHQTVPIEAGTTRFSIDFRTVHLDDHQARLGPVNVDNRSTGDALAGHVPVVPQP